MSAIQIKLHVDGYTFNIERHTFSFHQPSDYMGRPTGKPTNKSFDFSIYGSKETALFFEWATHSTMQKKCKIEFVSIHGNTKTRVVELWETHCTNYNTEYNHKNKGSFLVHFSLSPATILHNGQVLLSHPWRRIDPYGSKATTPMKREEKEPRIIDGWWSYDEEGEEKYVYNKNDKKTVIPLGETMYFHVLTENIKKPLRLKLYDYDDLFWFDPLDPDTDKFPNDPVIEHTLVDENGIATVKVDLKESWASVIADDHGGYKGSLDQAIELYWRVSMENIQKILPQRQSEYLKVTYNIKNLFIKPITPSVNNMPELYDYKGKLIVWAFKRYASIRSTANPTPYFSSVAITTVRITKTTSLSEINNVKTKILQEAVDWDSNYTKRIGFTFEEKANFIVKGQRTVEEVTEHTTKTTKKISDYFNGHDFKNGRDIVVKNARKLYKVFDYIKGADTIHSVFRDSQEGLLDIPKPTSVISLMSVLGVMKAIPALGPLSIISLPIEIISNQVALEIINEFTEEARLEWERRKLSGLNAARAWVQNGDKKTVGAKILSLDFVEYKGQTAYEKLLNNEFKTLDEFSNFKDTAEDDKIDNWYTCFYYKETIGDYSRYLIDSIFLH